MTGGADERGGVQRACGHGPQTPVVEVDAVGCDFVLISPVAPTASHPGVTPLGWSGLARLARHSRLPAYALGGMNADALPQAVAAGCIGVAAITAAWRQPEAMGEANVRRLLGGLPAL